MAKNDTTRREILRRLELERWERRLKEEQGRAARRRAGKSFAIRRHRGYGASPREGAAAAQKVPYVELSVPAVLDLGQNFDETCRFVQDMRRRIRGGGRVCMVLNDVKTIKPAALTYLLGQVHALQMEFGRDRLTGTYPQNPRIEQLLLHTGFYELLKVKPKLKLAREKRTRYIRFRSDREPKGEEIAKLRDELLGSDLSMPLAIRQKVFRALSEAMINVNHHAYLEKLGSASVRGRWWLLASLSASNNRFTLTFYDAGVGIPKTLPKRYPMEVIQYALSMLPGINPNDGEMISAAMELRRSRTGLQHRGRGLMDLAGLIDLVGDGHMDIVSRHGSYRYAPNGTHHQNHSEFVEGTLIEWHLPLDRALNVLPEDFYDVES